MEVEELKRSLGAFNQTAAVAVAIPQLNKPHEVRAIRLAGHIDHPGEAKTDHAIHALDIVCNPWDGLPETAEPKVATVADLLAAIEPFPGPMHVRVAVPLNHEAHSHRMLDIVMLGHAVGSGAGTEIQLICENFDNPMQIVKERPEAVARRLAEVGGPN